MKNLSYAKNVDFNVYIKDWFIGAHHEIKYGLNGTISDVTLWKEPFIETQIKYLYNDGKGVELSEIPKKN